MLSEIATWLADSYQNKIWLHGIILLHRITDNRLHGSAKRNLGMFRQLCGPDALQRVILVTTMWDLVAETEAAVAREELLVKTEDFWGWMLSQGSSSHRHSNTALSSRAIVDQLAMGNHNEAVVTDLQRQLVDERRPLGGTGAGRELDAEMAKEKDTWQQERLRMQQDMERATRERDMIAEQTQRDERDRYNAKIELMAENNNKFDSTMERLLADHERRVARLETELREQRAAHLEEMERANNYAQRHREEQAVLLATKDREGRGQREEIDELNRQLGQLKTAAGSATLNAQGSFSFAMNGKLFAFLNPGGIHGVWSEMVTSIVSGGLQAVSFGDKDGSGGNSWIAEYSDGTWGTHAVSHPFHSAPNLWDKIDNLLSDRATGLEVLYPNLGENLKARGLHNLEYCVLGPDTCYYARWKNGVACWAAPLMRSDFLAKLPSPARITAVAFGRDHAFVAAYCFPDRPRYVHNYHELRGHYKALHKFLSEERTQRIHLDVSSTHGRAPESYLL